MVCLNSNVGYYIYKLRGQPELMCGLKFISMLTLRVSQYIDYIIQYTTSVFWL